MRATSLTCLSLAVAGLALVGADATATEQPAVKEVSSTQGTAWLNRQMAALAEGRVAMVFTSPPLPAHPRILHRQVAASKWSALVPDAEARLRKTASLSNLARKPLVVLARGRAALAHDGLLAALEGEDVDEEEDGY